MKRRTFLQTTGLALTGGALVQGQPPSSPIVGAAKAKSLLVTSAESRLAQAIAAGLAGSYRITMASAVDLRGEHPVTKCDFSDPDATAALVRGNSGIIHVAQPPRDAPADAQIDWRTRGTYNLLQAAVREGVSCVLCLSSLDVVLGYPESYVVSEDWCPKPSHEAGPMSHYLGEFACREFAREERLRVCVLRLGHVARTEPAAGGPRDPLWLDERDAVQAVSRAIGALLAEQSRLGHWSVFHIVSEPRSVRFPATKANQVLGYRPQSAG